MRKVRHTIIRKVRHMSLTKEDIAETVELAVLKAIAPLNEMVGQHEMTLYGKMGNNGLRATVQGLVKFRWIVTGGILLLGAILGTFQFIIK